MSTPAPERPSLSSAPPEAWAPLLRLSRLAAGPLERFLRVEAAGGLLLLLATAVALAFANSPWAAGYARFWRTPVGLRFGGLAVERSLEWVVNDGLMVVFFFVVGLELRRELHRGELSTWRRAALPAAAALGGMLTPAALYLALAGQRDTRAGWGVPMATSARAALGVEAGLVVGKPAGVLLATFLARRLGLAELPRGVTTRHVALVGVVAGVGFTMALFIAQLAFVAPRLLVAAKVGVLGASLVAAVAALALGRATLRHPPAPGAARTADEAERSTEM